MFSQIKARPSSSEDWQMYDIEIIDDKGRDWDIGWIIFNDLYIPIVFIHSAKIHGFVFDKQEFAKKIKIKFPSSKGDYFLISEMVSKNSYIQKDKEEI